SSWRTGLWARPGGESNNSLPLDGGGQGGGDKSSRASVSKVTPPLPLPIEGRGSYRVTVNAPLYTTEILRLAASLAPPRELSRENGRAELRSPTCGSRVETVVQLDRGGQVAGLSQQVHACAFGQASAALLQQSALGRSRDEVEAMLAELTDWLGGGDAEPG